MIIETQERGDLVEDDPHTIILSASTQHMVLSSAVAALGTQWLHCIRETTATVKCARYAPDLMDAFDTAVGCCWARLGINSPTPGRSGVARPSGYGGDPPPAEAALNAPHGRRCIRAEADLLRDTFHVDWATSRRGRSRQANARAPDSAGGRMHRR